MRPLAAVSVAIGIVILFGVIAFAGPSTAVFPVMLLGLVLAIAATLAIMSGSWRIR